MYEVLEGGRSELLTEGGKTFLMAGRDGQVTPIAGGGSDSLTGWSGAGVTNNYNISVTAGMGANGPAIGDAIVNALKQYERRNGHVPIRTNPNGAR